MYDLSLIWRTHLIVVHVTEGLEDLLEKKPNLCFGYTKKLYSQVFDKVLQISSIKELHDDIEDISLRVII